MVQGKLLKPNDQLLPARTNMRPYQATYPCLQYTVLTTEDGEHWRIDAEHRGQRTHKTLPVKSDGRWGTLASH